MKSKQTKPAAVGSSALVMPRKLQRRVERTKDPVGGAGGRWLTVAVTPAIIARSKPSDCYHCLIAEALTEATGRGWHVWRKDARCEEDVPGRKIWKFPDFVRRAMNTFDARQPVEPFEFRIPSRFGGGGLRKRRTKSRAQGHNARPLTIPGQGKDSATH